MPRKQTETVRVTRQEWMMVELPYGIWTCPDGREVLFNRQYQPIWERSPGLAPVEADPNEWVPWARQRWFYTNNASSSPWASRASLATCEAVLAEWGIPIPDPHTKRTKPRSERYCLSRIIYRQPSASILPFAKPSS